MAAERLPMRKLREIIRLKLQAGQSGRAIALSCALSPSTVGEYLGHIALARLAHAVNNGAASRYDSRRSTIAFRYRPSLNCRLMG